MALGRAPQSVESVINHRLINGRHLVIGVSGGVLGNPYRFTAARAIRKDDYGALSAQRNNSAAGELPLDAWWWD